MKYTFLLTLLLSCTFGACQKSKNDAPADLFNGQQLTGKWNIVTSTVMLRFEDGTTQNVTRAGKPGEYLDFKHSKTTGHNAEGTFTTFGLGFTSTGKWKLAQDKAALDFIYDNPGGPSIYQFRIVDELSANKLILSADDAMVKLIYETNDLIDPGKKLVGGSIFEEYSR